MPETLTNPGPDDGGNNGTPTVRAITTQTARELSALHEATAALLSTLDLEALLGKILDAATSAISTAEKGLLYLIARDTGKLEMRAVLGYAETDPRIHKMSHPDLTGYLAKVVSERTPLLIYENEMGTASRAIITAPLILEDQVLGAIALESSNPIAFSRRDMGLLASFAVTATAAIRNAQLHAEVQRLAITDALTGLYNRRGLFEVGEREVERAHRFERSLAIVMLDIDNLKPINDTFGHSAGDKILTFVAEQCRRYTRKIDVVSRYGGDEFVILLPENDLFQATQVAERLRKFIVDTPIPFENIFLTSSVSAGISKVTAEIQDLGTLIKRADAALYIAKQAGRNQLAIK